MATRPSLLRVLVAAAALALGGAEARAGMLTAGAPFPDFALSDQTGAVVRSADLAGRSYLLWFYPKAQTPGCTTEARGLRDQYAALEAAGVTVLGVSFDEPADNRLFVEAEGLPFRLLSDEKKTLAIAVGAADSTWTMFARRISYLVGPDGKVRKAWDEVDPSTHASDVLAETGSAAPAAR